MISCDGSVHVRGSTNQNLKELINELIHRAARVIGRSL